MWLCGLNGDLPNCKVTAPPPFTRRSNQPSSLVKVKPSRGVLVLTRTPIRPVPRCVTTRPRTTADRLSGNNNVNDPIAVSARSCQTKVAVLLRLNILVLRACTLYMSWKYKVENSVNATSVSSTLLFSAKEKFSRKS